MRLAVIGGLASGPAAAAEAVRCNPDAEVVLFEQEPHISVGACELPYYLGAWIDEPRHLQVISPRQFEQTRGGTVRERHRVLSIDPRKRRLTVESLDHGSVHEEPFDRFVLAVGAHPRRLGLDGEDAPNVFTVRHLSEAIRMRQWLDTEPVRHAVVVGGGYIGAEVAETLRSRGLQVTVLDPVGRLLGGLLCDETAAPFMEAARAHRVTVRAERPTGLRHDRHGRVSAIETDRREVIGCDLVVVAIGIVPNTALAEAAGVKTGATGALAVDETMQTNVPSIYACGDVVEVPHLLSKRPTYNPLAPTARRTARVAARNAAHRTGVRDRFAPIVGVAGVKAFGVEAVRAGLSEAEARAAGFDVVTTQIRHWSRTSLYPGSKPLWVRLIGERGTGRLLGGELVGEEGAGLRANTLVPMLREGYTAAQVRSDIEFLYNPPMAPAVDPLLIACSQLAKAADTPPKARARDA